MELLKWELDYQNTRHCCEDILELLENCVSSYSLSEFFSYDACDDRIISYFSDTQENHTLANK